MKKILYIMIVLPVVACASFFDGTIPVKNTSIPSSAIAIKVSTSMIISWIYFRKDNKLYQAEKVGDYYILFNAAPGTYSLSHGESASVRQIFTDAMKKDCTVTVSDNEFVFLGSYSVKTDHLENIYKYGSMMRDLVYEIERTDYYYGEPVKQDGSAALKDFVSYMDGKLKVKGWNAEQFRLK